MGLFEECVPQKRLFIVNKKGELHPVPLATGSSGILMPLKKATKSKERRVFPNFIVNNDIQGGSKNPLY